MSWSWRIVILYVGFVSMILTLVFKARSEKVELVTPDYYAQELVYQGRIDAIKRACELSGPVVFEVQQEGIEVVMPVECKGQNLRGEIKLYRPSDSELDQQFPFEPDTAGVQLLSVKNLQTGYYLLQVLWKMNDQDYYFEKSIVIP